MQHEAPCPGVTLGLKDQLRGSREACISSLEPPKSSCSSGRGAQAPGAALLPRSLPGQLGLVGLVGGLFRVLSE